MTNNTKNRVADTFSMIVMGAVVVVVCVVVVYLGLSWQMAGYKDYITCNPGSNIGRIEWFMGVRPTQDSCWH